MSINQPVSFANYNLSVSVVIKNFEFLYLLVVPKISVRGVHPSKGVGGMAEGGGVIPCRMGDFEKGGGWGAGWGMDKQTFYGFLGFFFTDWYVHVKFSKKYRC